MRRLGIAQKLALAAAAAVVVLAAGVGVSYRESVGLGEALRHSSGRLQSLLLLAEARIEVAGLVDFVRAADDVESGLDIQRYSGMRDMALARLQDVIDLAEQESLRAGATAASTSVREEDEHLRRLVVSGDTEAIGAGCLAASAGLFKASVRLREVERQERRGVDEELAAATALSRKSVRYIVVALVLSVLLTVVGLGLVVRTQVVKPIRELTGVSTRIVESGDLAQRIVVHSHDEIGQLASTMQAVIDKLRDIPVTLVALVAQLERVVADLDRAVSGVTEGAGRVHGQANGAATLLDEVATAAADARSRVTALAEQASASERANRELLEQNRDTAQATELLADSAAKTLQTADRFAASAETVAASVRSLELSMADAASMVTEIETAIGTVGDQATTTRELAVGTAREAEVGTLAMRKATEGLETIRSTSGRVNDAVEQLGKRIEEVRGIVAVISEVADQTNLLAFNAAIIAAQAGEHGRGFSVVADEVKALANRVHQAASEISGVMGGILKDADEARSAAGGSLETVTRGVQAGQEADSAFARIVESAQRTRSMVAAIADSAGSQTHRLRRVAEVMRSTATATSQIQTTTGGQADEAEGLRSLAGSLSTTATQVDERTRAGASGAAAIARATQEVQTAAREIAGEQHAQSDRAARLRASVREIAQVSANQQQLVDALSAALQELTTHAGELSRQVRVFRC